MSFFNGESNGFCCSNLGKMSSGFGEGTVHSTGSINKNGGTSKAAPQSSKNIPSIPKKSDENDMQGISSSFEETQETDSNDDIKPLTPEENARYAEKRAGKKKKNSKGQYVPDFSDKKIEKEGKTYRDKKTGLICKNTYFKDGTTAIEKYDESGNLVEVEMFTNDRGASEKELGPGDTGKHIIYHYNTDGSYYIYSKPTNYNGDANGDGIYDPGEHMDFSTFNYSVYGTDGEPFDWTLGFSDNDRRGRNIIFSGQDKVMLSAKDKWRSF